MSPRRPPTSLGRQVAALLRWLTKRKLARQRNLPDSPLFFHRRSCTVMTFLMTLVWIIISPGPLLIYLFFNAAQ
jgi:hypothetical protein